MSLTRRRFTQILASTLFLHHLPSFAQSVKFWASLTLPEAQNITRIVSAGAPADLLLLAVAPEKMVGFSSFDFARQALIPLPEHIRLQPIARCCFQMNRAFQVSSVFRLLHRLCPLHGSQDKDIRIFRTVLLLRLYGDRFEMPILRLSALHRSVDFQSMYTFFRRKAVRSTFHFHFLYKQQYCGQAAERAAYRSHLRYHRCFSLFVADGRCRTAPACGTQNELKVSHDP